jgi:hypothetical protein
MGLLSITAPQETAMAEAWLSTVTKLTEFFSADQIEASARRTKFVQRASKITGKLFLALVTFGRWSAPKTSLAQLAAKAAQIEQPVEVTPEALQQRMNARAVAFLQDLLQTAFTKLHTGDLVCDEALFAPFARVHIADSTGFGLPDSLQAQFPGAGGSGCKAGAKIQLVWEYKSHSFDHFALSPWNVPDNKYVDTVTALARPHALFLFDLGYFKLTAFATIAAAQAYFLSRLNHQTTLLEVRGGRVHPLELARVLGKESRPLLEKAILLGARAGGGSPHRRPHARRSRQYPAPSSAPRREKAGLHALAGPSHPPGLEPLHYQRTGHPMASADGLHRILFKVASRTGVQVVEK